MPTAPAPTVSTAPAEGPRRWWAGVPRRLGRARTSTVVLAVLFVAIGVLYLYVRPEGTDTAPAGDTGDVPAVPAPVLVPTPEPTTTAPATSARPTSSAPATTTDSERTDEETEPTEDTEPAEDEATSTAEPSETSSTSTSSRTPTTSRSSTSDSGPATG